MKLTYRGVSYDYTPNPVPRFGPAFASGTYRGVPVNFYPLAEIPSQPAHDLTYRGVHYRSGGGGQPSQPEPVITPVIPDSKPAATVNPDVTAQSRSLFMRRHQRLRRREQGMLVRLAAEVGLPIEAAAKYASEIQGKVPHDFSGYERSATTMS